MTPVRRRRLLLLVAGALVVVGGLGACSGSDDPAATTADGSVPAGADADRQAYVAAAAGEMSIDDGDFAVCLAGALVDAIGMEDIVAADVSPTEFARASSLEEMGLSTTLDDPDALQAELAGCGDLVGIFAAGNDDAHEAACVAADLTNDLAAEMIVGDLTGTEPSAELAAARDRIGACILDAATSGT